jgi:hypothetical protein
VNPRESVAVFPLRCQLLGDRLDLPDMVQVVTCHGFDDLAEASLAAFRVGIFLRPCRPTSVLDQLQVPGALVLLVGQFPVC